MKFVMHKNHSWILENTYTFSKQQNPRRCIFAIGHEHNCGSVWNEVWDLKLFLQYIYFFFHDIVGVQYRQILVWYCYSELGCCQSFITVLGCVKSKVRNKLLCETNEQSSHAPSSSCRSTEFMRLLAQLKTHSRSTADKYYEPHHVAIWWASIGGHCFENKFVNFIFLCINLKLCRNGVTRFWGCSTCTKLCQIHDVQIQSRGSQLEKSVKKLIQPNTWMRPMDSVETHCQTNPLSITRITPLASLNFFFMIIISLMRLRTWK